MNPTLEQIEKVAEWWAVRTFDKGLNQNNGDDSNPLSFLLMNMASSNARKKSNPESREKFKQAIVKRLQLQPDEYLDVDYHPSQLLAECCVEAEIDSSMLPCKTFTHFDKSTNTFKGKYQYGGQFETIE